MARKKAATGSGSILNYFGPKASAVPASNRARTPDAASPISSMSSLSVLTSTPPEPLRFPRPGASPEDAVGGSQTPRADRTSQHSPSSEIKPRQPVSRDTEIAASDDDDSDDFEPLEMLLAPRAGPSTPSAKRVSTNHATTPDRRPGGLFSSPLTIQSRVRHFAMDDLLKDAKRDSSTQETYKRLQARREDESKGRRGKLAGDALRDTLMETVGNEEDHRLDKVVRAVERTETAATKQGWYLFRPNADSEEPNRYPFPVKHLKDICGKKVIVNSPHDLDLRLLGLSLKLKRRTLSDELFLWMLDEVCVEKSDIRRDEMCRIMNLYRPSSISSQVTPSYLEGLFMRLGASDDMRAFLPFLKNECNKAINVVGTPEEGLYSRDWRFLCSVLETILAMSGELEPDTMLYCIQVVLAISVDSELPHDPNVLLLSRKLILSITSTLTSSEWNSACEYITTFIYNTFPYPPLRHRSIEFLPTTTPETHELRRRMAAVFFFDDPSLASHQANTSFTLSDITSCLQSPAFKISPETDFAALRALLLLLDIAADTSLRPDAGAGTDAFDAEVDDLTATLRQLSRSINDTEMKSILPMEAKMVMDWVGERLGHAVRSRPRPRVSIYDLSDKGVADVQLPKQQNLMKKFLQSRRGACEKAGV